MTFIPYGNDEFSVLMKPTEPCQAVNLIPPCAYSGYLRVSNETLLPAHSNSCDQGHEVREATRAVC